MSETGTTRESKAALPEDAPSVEIWTDGGCKPNPGPGGWAALLCARGREREISGGETATTNNRMELTAAAEALEALKRPCLVTLHTDSEYLRNGITRWHTGWVRRNWRNAAGDPVKTSICGNAFWRQKNSTTSLGSGCAVIVATSIMSAWTSSRPPLARRLRAVKRSVFWPRSHSTSFSD